MRVIKVVVALLCMIAIGISVSAGLNPSEVLVVYNSSPYSSLSTASTAVADYYCDARGIPEANKFAIDWPFDYDLMNTKEFGQAIYIPLRDYVLSRGSDPANAGSDSLKCIILCFGLPSRMWDAERVSSVDSVLTTMFAHTPWGRAPMGITYGAGTNSSMANPYKDSGEDYLSTRGSKPTDFGEFRASSYNDVQQYPPDLTVIRMADADHAFLGGKEGMLYRCEFADGSWSQPVPTMDEDKDFVGWEITDIAPVSSQIAYACTAGGSILKTTNGGENWHMKTGAATRVSAWVAPEDHLNGIAFADATHGWYVGWKKNGATGPIFFTTTDGGDYWGPATLPTGMTTPRAVSAADSTHVWVAGDGGVYLFSGDGQGNWTWSSQQSSVTTIQRLRMIKVGSQYVGWAIGSNGVILHTTDGTSWHQDTTQTGAKDLCVFDASHAAISYSSGSFLRWAVDQGYSCGGHWIVDSSDTSVAKTSVATDGSGNVLAVGGKTVRSGRGAPATWTTLYTIPDAHMKMRYLVCRLDGYPEDADQDGIPDDIKNMIDRSLSSDNLEGPKKFILDGNSSPLGSEESWANTNLQPLLGPEDSVTTEPGQTYLTHQQNVMGYYSHGRIWDPKADLHTVWGRPYNTWHPGGIGIYASSFDGAFLRTPAVIWGLSRTGDHQANTIRMTGLPTGNQYNGCRFVVLSSSGSQLASVNFSDGTASIDVSGISYPGASPYCEMRFPDDDPLRPGECIPASRTSLLPSVISSGDWTAGVTFSIIPGHPLSADLIREGATGVTGNAEEPGTCMQPRYIFPRYAAGFTWAESAYLGAPSLGWQYMVLGDPLMAPYATPPSVSVSAPSTDAVVSGTVSVSASATPASGATGVSRMEAWITSGFRTDGIGTPVSELISSANNVSSLSCSLDTTATEGGVSKYANGVYTITVYAVDNSSRRSVDSAIRHICVNNPATSPTTITVTSPTGSHLYGDVMASATVGDVGSVASVEFWLHGSRCSVLAGTDTSASGNSYTCVFDSESFGDGNYTIQAVARCTSGAIVASAANSVSIANGSVMSITSPSMEFAALSEPTTVAVTPGEGIGSALYGVELIVCPPKLPPASLGVKTTAPYTWTVDPADYVYDGNAVVGAGRLRAIAYKSVGRRYSVAPERTAIYSSGYPVYSGTPGVTSLLDDDPVTLEGQVVTTCHAASLGTAFYVHAGSAALSGLRVVDNENVPTLLPGDMVTVVGSWAESSEGECQVAPEAVVVTGSATPVSPRGMSEPNLGGADRLGANGIDGAIGLYNIGEPARIFGRVTYVGNDFVYVDDGSGIVDGGGLTVESVPLNGESIATTYVKGVKTIVGDFVKPKLGDYVAATGISSLYGLAGGEHARLLRATGDPQEVWPYQTCYVWSGAGQTPFFAGTSSSQVFQVGDKVRIATEDVVSNDGDHFHAWCRSKNISGNKYGIKFQASTQLNTSYSRLVVIGTVTANDMQNGHSIRPDAVYVGAAGDPGMGLMSLGATPPTTEGERYRPWPFPTADEILASDSFKERYNELGAIGWALSQPDGTVVDLPGEIVISESKDGLQFGLKESYEPARTPQLTLVLNQPFHGLRPWMPTLDIIGGTLFTLPDGRRAIGNAQEVYADTDASGRYYMMMPWRKSYEANRGNSLSADWPWRVQIAP